TTYRSNQTKKHSNAYETNPASNKVSHPVLCTLTDARQTFLSPVVISKNERDRQDNAQEKDTRNAAYPANFHLYFLVPLSGLVIFCFFSAALGALVCLFAITFRED